jgi:hypothetical protein
MSNLFAEQGIKHIISSAVERVLMFYKDILYQQLQIRPTLISSTVWSFATGS